MKVDKKDKKELKKNLAVINIQEEDRQRIARDLHDTSLQNLAHIIHKIELAGMFIDKDPVKAKLELAVIKKDLKAIIEDIRNTIFNLRPMTFDDLGLKAALERLLLEFNDKRNYQIQVDIDEISCETQLILVTLYRVVQECFSNIKKHSEADKVIFLCKQKQDMISIDIEDNGKGFSEDEVEKKNDKHFGISVMSERVNLIEGKIVIHSNIGAGTKVHIEVPLH